MGGYPCLNKKLWGIGFPRLSAGHMTDGLRSDELLQFDFSYRCPVRLFLAARQKSGDLTQRRFFSDFKHRSPHKFPSVRKNSYVSLKFLTTQANV